MESEPSTSEEDSEDSEDISSEDKDTIEETYFRKLYHKILDDYIRRKNISDEKMAEAISFIIKSFNYKDGGDFSHIDFRRVEMICGYLFRYAPHGAGLTRCRTKEALRSSMQLRSILRKNELNVVSLGGGPGNDAIGFCSAISEFDFAGKLNIHVVDSIVKWSDVLSKAEKFLKEDALGNVSDIFKQGKATLNFTQCRLPGGFRDIPIGQCNIVLICKLFSIIKSEVKTGIVRVSIYYLFSLLCDQAHYFPS